MNTLTVTLIVYVSCDVLTRLTLEKASTRMGERGRAAHGVSAGGSADTSISESVRLELGTMIC